jgi:hypothetical protein
VYEEYIENQVFIGMQFASMDDIYTVLKQACENSGLSSVRVDQPVNSNSIIDDIKKMIEQSEFIILDLTHENPNVYYELGYADGAGNEGRDILLIAKEGTKLHFDVIARRVLFYKNSFDLQEQLKIKLPQFIDGGRK